MSSTSRPLDLSAPKHAHVAERLRENVIVWLASVRPDGRPHMVPVWYLWDGGHEVIILSKPDNQKVRDLQHNPAVMLALDDTKLGADVIMVEGTADLVPIDALRPNFPAYQAKYAARIHRLFHGDVEAMARSYSQGIRVTLSRVLE